MAQFPDEIKKPMLAIIDILHQIRHDETVSLGVRIEALHGISCIAGSYVTQCKYPHADTPS